METCPICNATELATHDERTMQACSKCALTLGVIPMPPVTRGPHGCRSCGGKKFLRSVPREHSAGNFGMDVNAQVSAPMMLTHIPRGHKGWVFRYAEPLDIQQGFGLLEVYACFKCGAVEWYCHGVERVPVSPHLMTDVVDYDDKAGPYR